MRESPVAVIVSWEAEVRGLTSGHRRKHPNGVVQVSFYTSMEQNRTPVRRPESMIYCPIRTHPAWRTPQPGNNKGLWRPQIVGEEQDFLSVWREFWIGAALGEQLRFTAAERVDGVNATTIVLRTKNDLRCVRREVGRCVIVRAPSHLQRLPACRLPDPDVHLAATGL